MNHETADPTKRYVQLWTFLGGYLYESWRIDYRSPTEPFREYLRASSDTDLTAFMEEADALLRESDSIFLAALRQLSTNFLPRADYGWDEREWLTSLRDRAQAELEARTAP